VAEVAFNSIQDQRGRDRECKGNLLILSILSKINLKQGVSPMIINLLHFQFYPRSTYQEGISRT